MTFTKNDTCSIQPCVFTECTCATLVCMHRLWIYHLRADGTHTHTHAHAHTRPKTEESFLPLFIIFFILLIILRCRKKCSKADLISQPIWNMSGKLYFTICVARGTWNQPATLYKVSLLIKMCCFPLGIKLRCPFGITYVSHAWVLWSTICEESCNNKETVVHEMCTFNLELFVPLGSLN